MRNEWIIDVLADLKAYAEHNGMAATAAGLEDALLVALAEISSLQSHGRVGEAQAGQSVHARDAGNVTLLSSRRGLA